MLSALGTFLNTIIAPMNAMGGMLSLNMSTLSLAVPSLAGANMSTVAFAVFASPWVEDLGSIVIGLGGFVSSLVGFLVALTDLL